MSEGTESSAKLAELIGRLTVLLVSIVMTLLLCELIVRVVAPTETLTRYNEDFHGLKAVRSNITGFHQIPDTFRKTYSTSTQRFRGKRLYSQQPGAGVLRIAVLGDSFTFGWGANDDETYPAVLETILAEKMGPVEVINAGALGDGTGDEALWYDEWVRRFHPQLVILTVVPNDTDDDLARTLFTVDPLGEAHPLSEQQLHGYQHSQRTFARLIDSIPGYEYLGEHSQLLSLFRRVVSLKMRTQRISRWEKGQANRAFETVGLPLLGAEVSWLNKRVQQANAKLVVTFVPFRDTIYRHQHSPKPPIDKPDEMITVLTRICETYGIPFFDMTPEIRAEASSDKVPLYYMTKYDSHPTPEGYRVMAENLAAFIKELHYSVKQQ